MNTPSRQICAVLPYRYGDLLIAMPFLKAWADEGNTVSVVVHEEFVSLLEGVSYVTPIVFNGRVNDIKAAVELAKERVPGSRIYPLKSGDCGYAPDRHTTHFSAEIWQRAGELNRYHELPLILDRRDSEREKKLVELSLTPAAHNKPILAYCLKGHSFRYAHGPTLKAWLEEENTRRGEPWYLLDLTEIAGKRIYDMLGLLERADCLLSVDTAFVHLAHASDTPTVVVVPERDYDSPEPRSHWIGRVRGEESASRSGGRRLERWLFDWSPQQRLAAKGSLCRRIGAMYAEPILFAIIHSGEVSPAIQAKARASYFGAKTRDRFWVESDILMPMSMIGAPGVMDSLLRISPSFGDNNPYMAIVICPAGHSLNMDAPHRIRAALALDPCLCCDSDGADAGGDGPVAFTMDWWWANAHRITDQHDWAGFRNFVRNRSSALDKAISRRDEDRQIVASDEVFAA